MEISIKGKAILEFPLRTVGAFKNNPTKTTKAHKILDPKIDQSGFLPKRQLRDNVRTILNVTEYLQYHKEKQTELIFLHKEKV